MITIRKELPDDIPAVQAVNERAFEQPLEAGLVNTLRQACPDALSLVAVDGDEVVGHIMFTPATIETDAGMVVGMGLAPMAVQPDRQRQSIGTKLAAAGIDELKAQGCAFVIVLGHSAYYPRFGFVPASHRDIQCQWDGVPDDAFMVLILNEAKMTGVSGVARYRPEFDDAV